MEPTKLTRLESLLEALILKLEEGTITPEEKEQLDAACDMYEKMLEDMTIY